MNIEAKNIECTINSEEASTLAYALMRDLRESVKTHWINHGESKFFTDYGVKLRLRLMEQFFSVEGRHDLYRMYFDEMKSSFAKATGKEAA